MTKVKFTSIFEEAIKRTLDKAKKSLIEEIPEGYLIDLKFRDGKKVGPITKEQAVDEIVKDEKIPEWININFFKIEDDKSIISCELSDRYFEKENELMYQEEGVPPFRIGFPPLPEAYEEGKKFSIKDLRKN